MTINGHGCIGHDDWLSLVHMPTACTTYISANVAFPSPGTETSLTETAIKEEESLIVNGVKTEDIALCSSRSRQHRNSYGPRSRRGSSSDDLSPQHRKREEVKQSTGRPPPVTRKNRDSLEGSKITVDVDSIMRLMSGDLESEDEDLVEEEEEEVEILKMKPILRAEEIRGRYISTMDLTACSDGFLLLNCLFILLKSVVSSSIPSQSRKVISDIFA